MSFCFSSVVKILKKSVFVFLVLPRFQKKLFLFFYFFAVLTFVSFNFRTESFSNTDCNLHHPASSLQIAAQSPPNPTNTITNVSPTSGGGISLAAIAVTITVKVTRWWHERTYHLLMERQGQEMPITQTARESFQMRFAVLLTSTTPGKTARQEVVLRSFWRFLLLPRIVSSPSQFVLDWKVEFFSHKIDFPMI